MRFQPIAVIFPVILAAATVLAQEPPPPPTPPAPSPVPSAPPAAPTSPTTPPEAPEPPALEPMPPPLSPIAASGYDRRDVLPNIYLADGRASIRLRKLIKNVLFESQIDYKFVTGDISTFLRYKYYAQNFTYKVSVFDSISFGAIGSSSQDQFERVRGGLLLLEFPRDYNHRYFTLLEDDRLTFGDLTNVDNRKNNIYTKFGYQYGTEFDEQLNSIVGESRGLLIPVLTVFRDLGPQKFSYAAAITEGGKISTGDYQYTKLEADALHRFDITSTSFLVTRGHAGTFLSKQFLCANTPATPPVECYSIPGYEMFNLGGSEALRSLQTSNSVSSGTDEFDLTNEYFVPVFRNRDYRYRALHFNTAYAIAYAGFGNASFAYRDLFKTRNFAVDAGIGTEVALTVRDYDVIVSLLFAHTLRAPDERKSNKVQFSIHTTH
jgi:hypothetical protein